MVYLGEEIMVQIPPGKFDDWVANVADPKRNPAPPRGVVTFFGYLNDADPLSTNEPTRFDPAQGAPSKNPATRTRYRLYLTLQLDHYLVIQEEDIIHYLRVPNLPSTPLGGMLLWVKSDAVIEHVPLNSRAAQAGFLRGPIVANELAQANMSPQAAGGGGSFACPGGGGSFACPGGGASFACPAGGVSLVGCG
jgi:hypothetical protein